MGKAIHKSNFSDLPFLFLTKSYPLSAKLLSSNRRIDLSKIQTLRSSHTRF